jgi:preprotein translocase SecF subunit
MKFMENTKINFMKFKTIGFGLSSAMAIGSILLLLMGVNLGIDFKGGTAIGVSFSEDISIEEIRSSLKTVSFNDTNFDLSAEEIKYFGSNSDVMIKIKTLENEPENFGQLVINHLYGSLNTKVPENKNDFILSLGSVSPKVGSELSGKALWSVISALVLILFYISVRFEFRFALGAILALVHDVIITLGIFSLTGFEITLSTVAAFLTIVGYSLNDTIVILDRIRENMKSSGTVMFESTINKSINQSLSRTLITSLTTLLVIIVLLIYGGEVIRPFSFTMLVGVIIGTYSSIYIASALLATIYQNSK